MTGVDFVALQNIDELRDIALRRCHVKKMGRRPVSLRCDVGTVPASESLEGHSCLDTIFVKKNVLGVLFFLLSLSLPTFMERASRGSVDDYP